MEIPTHDQKKAISECWSRSFDYADYVNYSNKVSTPVVKESTYDYYYAIYNAKYRAFIRRYKTQDLSEETLNPIKNCVIRIKKNEEDKTD